ncbi:MAG TPA: hypothetical protein VFF73_34355, partial [Planctomycetota bacterium]|nr:hypothetical protein [Planctomycetota bacterium]
MRRALAALGLLVAVATPCFANDPEKDKQFVGLCIGCLTVVPLALFPVGLAFHLLLKALAPRRARFLIDAAESGRARTFLLGFLN